MELAAGTHVGPYILLERLGVGGMGEVYLGLDPRLNRKVALKCLRASQNESEQQARILHEARAAAQINHPNVAVIHDVIDEGFRAYIVMEYMKERVSQRACAAAVFRWSRSCRLAGSCSQRWRWPTT